VIKLDWPPKELHPNARVYFRTKAAVTKIYRKAAYERADWGNFFHADVESDIAVRIMFHPPDRRRRDLDNMLASIKAGIDGIADALCINDRLLNPITIERCEPVKGGRVLVTFA
jgi:crossover junction endodeoxyribonuclease RusA